MFSWSYPSLISRPNAHVPGFAISVYLCQHDALSRRKIEQCGERIEEKHKQAKGKRISWRILHAMYKLKDTSVEDLFLYVADQWPRE